MGASAAPVYDNETLFKIIGPVGVATPPAGSRVTANTDASRPGADVLVPRAAPAGVGAKTEPASGTPAATPQLVRASRGREGQIVAEQHRVPGRGRSQLEPRPGGFFGAGEDDRRRFGR